MDSVFFFLRMVSALILVVLFVLLLLPMAIVVGIFAIPIIVFALAFM